MSDFTYLHVHTHFSGGGGPSSPAEWCRQAAALGYKALAMADRGPLAGLPAFLDAAQHEGLTPICGAELDVLLPSGGTRKTEPISMPAVLFARDSAGLANLSRLCALAYQEWPTSEEAVTWEALAEHSQGLVLVLPGEDAAGAVTPLVDLTPKKLADLGGALKERFGDAAFVGLPHAGGPEDGALSGRVASAAENMGLPLVAMPVARYLQPQDALSYAALRYAREQAGWVGIRSQESGVGSQEYLRSPDEVKALFSNWPSAIENVARIVEMCVPIQNSKLKTQNSAEDTLALGHTAERRLLALLSVEELPGDVRERLDAELRVVGRCGRTQAWLALGSLVETARSNRVPLGAPLGMADGTLLAYALGLSSLSPMPYARPSWLSLADEDGSPPLPGIEVPSTRREMLVSALTKEYGAGRIAHAACAACITPIAAAQAAGIALDVPGDEARSLLAQAIEKGWAAFDTDRATLASQRPSPGTLALSLRDVPLSFKPDTNTLLIAPPNPGLQDERQGSTGLQAPSQAIFVDLHNGNSKWVPWTEEALCRLNYPAISLPPSHALDALNGALMLAAKHPVPGLPISTLDLSPAFEPDASTLTLITKGEVRGVPYIAPKVAKGWNGCLTPEGMAALVAHSIQGHKIQNSKFKIQNLEGDLLYRDQLDNLMEVAGMASGDAAVLRRSLLKPELDADGVLQARFVEGCVRSGVPEEEASALKDALLASAHGLVSRYAAHAWGRIAMWSAVVKATHPAALLAGALSVAWERGVRAHVAALTAEAPRLGITILPPDASRSLSAPGLEREGAGWAVLWGLALLPGWSTRQAARFTSARPPQGFATVRDLVLAAAGAELSLAQLDSLVRSGACDHLGSQPRDRQALLDALPSMLEWAQGSHPGQGQVDLFMPSATQEPPVGDASTLAVETPSPRERQGYRAWEEANLGVAFTQAREMDNLRQALDGAGDLRSRLLTSAQITPGHVGESIFLVGILSGVSLLGAKEDASGSSNTPPLAVAQVEDLEGSIELVAFPPNYKRHQRLWTEHNLAIITARVCRHEDGALYLLCEQLAPFHGEQAEEELNLKVRASRGGARPADSPPGGTDSVKDSLSQTEVVAVARPASSLSAPMPSAPRTPPLNGNGHNNGSAHSNGNGNGNSTHAQPITAATGTSTYKLIITLPFSNDDHTDIDTMIALNKLLIEHPGSDTVTLRIPYSPEPGAVTIGHLPRGARYNSHLEAKLRDLLGSDALAIIKLVG